MKCKKCSTINRESANFCFNCGIKFTDDNCIKIFDELNVIPEDYQLLEDRFQELTKLNNLLKNNFNSYNEQKKILTRQEQTIKDKEIIIKKLNNQINTYNEIIESTSKEINRQVIRISDRDDKLHGQDTELKGQYKEMGSLHNLIQEKEELLMQQNEELIAKEEELISQNEELINNREQLKGLVNELEASNLALEELNRHKTKFLTNMSHELRTPLNAIIGFTQLLDKQYYGQLNEKQLEYIELISHSGAHLLSLVNDLLDMSKIDAGTMKLDLSTFDVEELVKTVNDMHQNQFKEKGVSLEYSIDSDVKEITADLRKCKQILLNLLTNALKYTPAGGKVLIEVKRTDNYTAFHVIDNGIGIFPDAQELIFNDFYQCIQDTVVPLNGVGIGLALSKRLVEMHSGKITVESVPEEYCEFCFTIPINSGE